MIETPCPNDQQSIPSFRFNGETTVISQKKNIETRKDFTFEDIDKNVVKIHRIFLDPLFSAINDYPGDVFIFWFKTELDDRNNLLNYIYTDHRLINIPYLRTFSFKKLLIAIQDDILTKEILNYINLSKELLAENFSSREALKNILMVLLDFYYFLRDIQDDIDPISYKGKLNVESSFEVINSLINNIISNCLNEDNFNALLESLSDFFNEHSIKKLNSEILNKFFEKVINLKQISLDNKMKYLQLYAKEFEFTDESESDFLRKNLKALILPVEEPDFEVMILYTKYSKVLNIYDETDIKLTADEIIKQTISQFKPLSINVKKLEQKCEEIIMNLTVVMDNNKIEKDRVNTEVDKLKTLLANQNNELDQIKSDNLDSNCKVNELKKEISGLEEKLNNQKNSNDDFYKNLFNTFQQKINEVEAVNKTILSKNVELEKAIAELKLPKTG